MESLRNELLSILLNSETRVGTPSIGSSVIKDSMKNTKALVVLDDVSSFQHIEGMDLNFFGDGSKIIVTSREHQVLARADEIHVVKGLCDNNSLQLFSTFAFKPSEPVADEFRTVLSKFLRYAQGNPLALKVLGSFLCGKPIDEWESEVENLGESGNPEILDILKISYRVLRKFERDIFLDIAIFFKGDHYHKEDVDAFLEGCYGGGYSSGVRTLVDKCLLEIRTIHPYNGEPYQSFYMHDMLEELGKDIESNDPSGNPRRLWRPEHMRLLNNNKADNSIEGINTIISDSFELHQTIFQNMPNLRFIRATTLYPHQTPADVDIKSLPDELRYLEWLYCPFESLSSTFNPVNLVALKLSRGIMKRLWNGNQVPVNLRELDVSWCEELEEIPNLSGATTLKILNCYNCTSLVKLAGLRNLASLEMLLFGSCRNLVKIPSLSGATKLKTLQCLSCTSLVELPSLNHLTSLERLILYGCRSLKKFPNLPNNFSELDLSKTGIEQVSASIEHLTGVKSLIMSGSKVKKVSRNISKLESLQVLRMDSCYGLETLPQLPSNLVQLDAHNCTSLTEVSFTEEDSNLPRLDPLRDKDEIFYIFSECSLLKPESVNNIVEYVIQKIRYLAVGSLRGLYPRSKQIFCCLPEKEISANKFEFQSEGSRLTFEIDKTVCSPCEILAFAVFIVVDLTCLPFSKDQRVVCRYQLTALTAAGRDECGCHTYCLDNMLGLMRRYTRDHMLILLSDKLIFKGEYKKASFTFHFDVIELGSKVESSSMRVKKCGVHVFPMDLRGFQCSDEMSKLEYQEDARSEEFREDSATEEDSSIVMRNTRNRVYKGRLKVEDNEQ